MWSFLEAQESRDSDITITTVSTKASALSNLVECVIHCLVAVECNGSRQNSKL
jgi:hypothetical protein